MRIEEANVPDDLISFVEAEAANAANLPGCTVDVFADPELVRIGFARVIEALIHGRSVPRAVKEAGCFENWLQGKLQCDGATGKVARWVTQEIMLGQWQSEHILLKRFGHTCDTLAHHERRLKGRGLPRESIETFFGVYDEYLADAMNGYDQKIRNINGKEK